MTSYMFTLLRRGKKVRWDVYGPLREAIESKLMSSVREIARIVTKSKTRDRKQQKKYGDMIGTLMNDYGYSEDSAEEVLKYAANHLWRDN